MKITLGHRGRMQYSQYDCCSQIIKATKKLVMHFIQQHNCLKKSFLHMYILWINVKKCYIASRITFTNLTINMDP